MVKKRSFLEEQRNDRAPDRHRHACIEILIWVHLAKQIGYFFPSVSGQEINSGVGGFQGR